MAASSQIVTLQSSAVASGDFVVTGVFWLTAPANSVVPLPTFRSQVPGITSADLASLRSGAIVEVPFSAPHITNFSYPAGTTQAQVDSDIQALFAIAQAALNAQNPALSTSVNRAFNGASWAPYGGSVGAFASGQPLAVMTELYRATSLGLIPGVLSGRAFGYVLAVTAAQFSILGTTFTPQAAGVASQISISSSSASDNAAGTGASSVTVNYYTLAWVLKSETIALNGVTAVNSVGTDFAYFESAQVATTGSNKANVGAISFFKGAAGAGGTWCTISATDNQTNLCHHYIPSGKTCYVTGLAIGGTLAAGRGNLVRTGNPGATNLPVLPIGGLYGHIVGESNRVTLEAPVPVVGPDRVLLVETTNVAVANNVALGSFEYLQL